MARGNPFMGTLRGKLGDTVFSRRLGEQASRAYVKEPRNANTRSQVVQRSKLGNIVASYRAYRTLLQRAFESKPVGNTDYNVFTSLNLKGSNIYFDGEMTSAGACIVAPYRISRGTLPEIQVVETVAGTFQSDIQVANGFVIDADTTIAQLTEAILSTNQDWIIGDQFSAVQAEQWTSAGGYPMCSVRLYEFVLSNTDTTLVREIFPEAVLDIINGYLGFSNPDFIGGVAAVHSRNNAAGRLLVSPQQIMLTSNNDVYAYYSSAENLEQVLLTRGYNEGVFLDPRTASRRAGAPIGANVVLTTIGTANGVWPEIDGVLVPDGGNIAFRGSGMLGLRDNGSIHYHDGSVTALSGVQVNGVPSDERLSILTPDDAGKSIKGVSVSGVYIINNLTEL